MCFEELNNGNLIENNLLHLLYELRQTNPMYFRVAKEAYLTLYRSMIEALRGTSNISITCKRGKKKNGSIKYKRDNKPWLEINKKKVQGCNQAWRYSEPMECPEQKLNPTNYNKLRDNNYLINFFDALAMIQTECFMHRYVNSRSLKLTDEEMQILEWLHIKIRNEFEHFVPKIYLAEESSLLNATQTCMKISKNLLFGCGLLLQTSLPTTIDNLINNAIEKIDENIKKINELDI